MGDAAASFRCRHIAARRVGDAVAEYNFGSIEVDWVADDPRLRLLNIDHIGAERDVVELPLSDLRARRALSAPWPYRGNVERPQQAADGLSVPQHDLYPELDVRRVS